MDERRKKQLIEDLCDLEPALRHNEGDLEKLIAKFLANNPDTKFDSRFAANLRINLMARGAVLQEKGKQDMGEINVSFMQRFKYVFGGAVVVALVLLVVAWQGGAPGSIISPSQKALLGFDYQVTKVEDRAFGSFSAVSDGAEFAGLGGGVGREDSVASSPRGMGGGGAGMIAPDFVSYKYVYKGEGFALEQDNIEVFRRVKGSGLSRQVTDALKGFDFGAVDIRSFRDSQVEMISFREPQESGYQVYMNFYEGAVSISLADPYLLDRVQQQVTVEQLPDEARFLEAAEQFIRARGIKTDNYGQPEVRRDYLMALEQAVDKSNFWVPQVSVVYPLLIEGQEVYDQSGQKTGMWVYIRSSDLQVMNLWGLSSQLYQSSFYPSETNIDRIMNIVERGGLYNYFSPNAPGQVEVVLGDPSVRYVQFYNYRDGMSDELFVPALVFPITEVPDGVFIYQKNVVILLVKELIDQSLNQQPDIFIR